VGEYWPNHSRAHPKYACGPPPRHRHGTDRRGGTVLNSKGEQLASSLETGGMRPEYEFGSQRSGVGGCVVSRNLDRLRRLNSWSIWLFVSNRVSPLPSRSTTSRRVAARGARLANGLTHEKVRSSVGDTAVRYPSGCVWVVSGQRDGRWVVAEGRTPEASGRFPIETRQAI
jgi:hypothetical protein